MPNHTAKSLEAALCGMPPDAPILVRVDGTLRPVALVRPAWVAGGVEDSAGAVGAQYAPVMVAASDYGRHGLFYEII